jgi:hypothetical protein
MDAERDRQSSHADRDASARRRAERGSP